MWGGREGAAGLVGAMGALPNAWTSFWGRFGYGQIPLPEPVYAGLGVLLVASVAGWVRLVAQSIRANTMQARLPEIGLLVLSVAVYLAGTVYYISLSPTGANGRYLYPALPAIGLLVSRGLCAWRRGAGVGWPPGHWLCQCWHCRCGPFSECSCRRTLLPGAPGGRGRRQHVAGRGTFDDLFELVGYQTDTADVLEGDSLGVTLYWRALAPIGRQYSIGLVLLGRGGVPVAKLDCFPGGGTYPTTCWKPGEILVDRYRLTVTGVGELPSAAHLVVFLHGPDGGNASVMDAGGKQSDRASFGQVRTAPSRRRCSRPRNSVDATLGGLVRMVGYDVSGFDVRAGDVLTTSLYWQAEKPLQQDYQVFLHLVRDGKPVAQGDGPPSDGAYPSSLWRVGEVVADLHRVSVARRPRVGRV